VRKGHVKARGYKALNADMVIERNVTIPLRDGIKIYADIFWPPAESDKVSIIVAWSPYGKHGNNNTILVNLPERVGLPKDTHSGYEDFEGPDPGFWCVGPFSLPPFFFPLFLPPQLTRSSVEGTPWLRGRQHRYKSVLELGR
jgi:hypothetical protein